MNVLPYIILFVDVVVAGLVFSLHDKKYTGIEAISQHFFVLFGFVIFGTN